MTAAGFCSWKTAEQNLAGSPRKSLREPALWKHDWRLERYKLQSHPLSSSAAALFSWTQSFFTVFQRYKGKQCQDPSPALCWEQDDRARADLQWRGMITAFSTNASTRCLALLQARSLSNIHRVFHTVIRCPAHEVQESRHFPYWAAKQ